MEAQTAGAGDVVAAGIFSEKTLKDMRSALGEEGLQNVMKKVVQDLQELRLKKPLPGHDVTVGKAPAVQSEDNSSVSFGNTKSDTSPRLMSHIQQPQGWLPSCHVTVTRNLSQLKQAQEEMNSSVRNYSQITIPTQVRNTFSTEEIYKQAYGHSQYNGYPVPPYAGYKGYSIQPTERYKGSLDQPVEWYNGHHVSPIERYNGNSVQSAGSCNGHLEQSTNKYDRQSHERSNKEMAPCRTNQKWRNASASDEFTSPRIVDVKQNGTPNVPKNSSSFFPTNFFLYPPPPISSAGLESQSSSVSIGENRTHPHIGGIHQPPYTYTDPIHQDRSCHPASSQFPANLFLYPPSPGSVSPRNFPLHTPPPSIAQYFQPTSVSSSPLWWHHLSASALEPNIHTSTDTLQPLPQFSDFYMTGLAVVDSTSGRQPSVSHPVTDNQSAVSRLPASAKELRLPHPPSTPPPPPQTGRETHQSNQDPRHTLLCGIKSLNADQVQQHTMSGAQAGSNDGHSLPSQPRGLDPRGDSGSRLACKKNSRQHWKDTEWQEMPALSKHVSSSGDSCQDMTALSKHVSSSGDAGEVRVGADQQNTIRPGDAKIKQVKGQGQSKLLTSKVKVCSKCHSPENTKTKFCDHCQLQGRPGQSRGRQDPANMKSVLSQTGAGQRTGAEVDWRDHELMRLDEESCPVRQPGLALLEMIISGVETPHAVHPAGLKQKEKVKGQYKSTNQKENGYFSVNNHTIHDSTDDGHSRQNFTVMTSDSSFDLSESYLASDPRLPEHSLNGHELLLSEKSGVPSVQNKEVYLCHLPNYLPKTDMPIQKQKKQKQKQRGDVMDVEVFDCDKASQYCNRDNKNVAVPPLNLIDSSGEDDYDKSKLGDLKSKSYYSKTKFVRSNTDSSSLPEKYLDIKSPPKQQMVRKNSQNARSDVKLSLQQIKSSSAEPVCSKSKSSLHSKARDDLITPTPRYQRHWVRSSIAWSSYNPRELSTKSSLQKSAAGDSQKYDVPAVSNKEPVRDGCEVVHRTQSKQRPASADIGRKETTNNSHQTRPSSAQYPVRSNYLQASPLDSGTKRVDIGQRASHCDQLQAGDHKLSRLNTTASEISSAMTSFEQDASTSGPTNQEVESPRILVTEIHRLPPVEAGDGYTDKLQAVAHTAYQRLREMTPRIANGQFSLWQCLPDEIWLFILNFLSPADLHSLILTSRYFYRLANDETLWKYITVKRRYPMTDSALKTIADHHPTSLAMIKCQGAQVTLEGLHYFFRETQHKLQELNMCGCSQGSLVGSVVLEVASLYCRQLTHLDASYCSLTDQALLAISQCAQGFKSLCVNGFQSLTDSSMLVVLQKHGNSLQTLELYACLSLTNATFQSVGRLCPNLRRLCLGSCYKLTDAAMISLSCYLSHIEELDLRGCKNLRDDCIRKIVHNCTRIQTLVLANCHQVSDLAVAEVATYLKKTLRVLDVCGCDKVTDNAVVSLAKNCDRLTSLDISSTKCTNISLLELTRSVCSKTLESMRLSFLSGLTESCLLSLIHGCPRLKSLHVFGCSTLRNLTKLQSANPQVLLEGDSDVSRTVHY